MDQFRVYGVRLPGSHIHKPDAADMRQHVGPPSSFLRASPLSYLFTSLLRGSCIGGQDSALGKLERHSGFHNRPLSFRHFLRRVRLLLLCSVQLVSFRVEFEIHNRAPCMARSR